MEQEEHFPIANLSSEQLTKIKNMEEDLRSSTGEEIVLIAYRSEEE